jgi:thioredoxin reductase (NADPH)
LKDNSEISCHALMVATGVQWRRLDAPGIDRLQGAGVYYGGGSIELWTHANVAEAHGETHLEEISVLCSDTNKIERVPASSMFIFIGALPRTDWLSGLVERDERGFILTGPDLMWDGKRPKSWILERDPFLLETNIPGLFAVGDVRHGSVKRVASGVGEGSVAVQFIHQYLSKV